MNIVCKEVETIEEFIDYIRIREAVFVLEQKGNPGWEPDELDKHCRHFVAMKDGKIVATTRFRESKFAEYKIERIATAKELRGQGIAQTLLEHVLEVISELKPKRVWLVAQHHAQGFYEKFGFKLYQLDEDAGTAQFMELKL